MRLTRVHVSAPLEAGRLLELPRETAAHLAKVLRLRSGDAIVLFNGDGREFEGAVETVRGSRVAVSIGTGRESDRESRFSITLVQCVPRGDRMDLVVQKATELGVTRIVPVMSQRSVVRLDAAQAESKAGHWRAVVSSACEQCGRNRLPVIETPLPLLHYLGSSPAGTTRLVLEPDRPSPGAGLDPGGGAEIAVGPEGGFAEEELEALSLAGFLPITLGPRILRAETAAIAAVTWLQTRFGDMHPAQGPGSPGPRS